ncbi:MAG TPA: sodium:solute symporter [Sporichthyaceae bacterium]|nr:sodium:solute symporter [Sporichthyaceae bacterium]
MSPHVDRVALAVFLVLFGGVATLGFLASRWRRAASLNHLEEWGLGGRNFGGFVTWFLIGGDLYTAYTFVAVPALVYGAGALGFFAVPYTALVYPMIFFVALRMWSVAKAHNCVTAADFVQLRHGSPGLALAVAVTGIVATMPYIALQLTGVQAVIESLGIGNQKVLGTTEWPLILAFAVLAAFTYHAGLRAPAVIAFVKDTLVYIVVITAVIAIPIKLHGFHRIFAAADQKFTTAHSGNLILTSPQIPGYLTLYLGSAMALFLYPHAMTALFAARDRTAIKRNMAGLPAFSVVLGLIAMLGFMAIAAGVKPVVSGGKPDVNTIVPQLFATEFPSWFTGLAYAAIAIGALVPAAIMSIAAANLFSRNIWLTYVRPNASPAEQAKVSKLVSLLVKAGAVAVILKLDTQFSIDLQLIGGVIILQTLPAIVGGLYTRWFHRWALLAGWAVGLFLGLWMLYVTPNPAKQKLHFGGSSYALRHLGLHTQVVVYPGLVAVAANLAVAVVLTPVLRAAGLRSGVDRTAATDYEFDPAAPAAALARRAS